MSPITGFAVYFIIWWITLFAVLPFGIRSQKEAGGYLQGTDPGAPVRPRIWLKLAVNSVVAGIVFGCWWLIFYRLGFGLDQLPSIFPQDRG
jgi:predicted secreted protein